jgi:uncharacterized protein (DUF1499 family)
MMILQSLLATALALGVVVLAWRGYVQRHLPVLVECYGGAVDFATLTRTIAPHDHLRATEQDAPNASADAPPLVLDAPPDRVAGVIQELFGALVLARDGRSFALLERTSWLGFPDFVTLAVRDDPAGARVLAYSSSVYGHADFGANRARVERWLAMLDARLAGR